MSAKFFGEFLQSQGLIDRLVVERVLEIQESCNLRLGKLASYKGLLTEQQALEINLRQQVEDKKFGDIAQELGLLKHEQLTKLLELQENQHQLFGDILIELGIFSQSELNYQLQVHQQQKCQAAKLLSQQSYNHPLGPYLAAMIKTNNKLFLRNLHQQSQFSQFVSQVDELMLASISCQITLSGERPISITMLTNPKTAAIIAHKFTMIPQEECDLELSSDAFGEFLNIIIGHLIDESDVNIPAERTATKLNINIPLLCDNASQLLIAEVDTQIGILYIIVSA
jgi:hypothetical protein